MRVMDFHVHTPWTLDFPRREENPKSVAEKLNEYLAEEGVDRAVLLPMAPFSSNDLVARVVDLSPDKFIGFASVLPNLGSYATNELRYAIEELGLRGLKLHPGVQGFSLRNPRVWDVLKTAGELGIPCLIDAMLGDYSTLHFKTKPVPWMNSFDDYALLPYVAPNTTIVLAHMGGLLGFERMAELAAGHDDVYLDTSYSIISVAERYDLARYVKLVGAEKFVFGSDYVPGMTPKELRARRQMEIVLKLDIGEDDKEKMLWGNAQRILGI